MKMKVIESGPKTAEVISLKEAHSRYRIGACQHMNLSVDETLWEVVCDDCGEKLNPVYVLARFAREETRFAREGEKLRKLGSDLDARVCCKCQHCGQMTRIRG